MKSLFIVDSPHEQYLLLDKIQYVDPLTNELTGGYWISENTVAPLPNTVMVVVNTSDEILAAMALQTEHWIYVDEVDDEMQTA